MCRFPPQSRRPHRDFATNGRIGGVGDLEGWRAHLDEQLRSEVQSCMGAAMYPVCAFSRHRSTGSAVRIVLLDPSAPHSPARPGVTASIPGGGRGICKVRCPTSRITSGSIEPCISSAKCREFRWRGKYRRWQLRRTGFHPARHRQN